MKAIIDTSSLRALAKYYLPFDKNGALKAIIHEQFIGKELLVLDKVALEGRFQAKQLIYNSFPFLYEKDAPIINTTLVLPNQRIFNRLENDFCDKQVLIAKGLNDAEFEAEKSRFLNQADAKIILYALQIQAQRPLVVSEETVSQNDNKIFKKIPTLCSLTNTDCCTLPEFIKDRCNIDLAKLFI